jgi:hypothetical protein
MCGVLRRLPLQHLQLLLLLLLMASWPLASARLRTKTHYLTPSATQAAGRSQALARSRDGDGTRHLLADRRGWYKVATEGDLHAVQHILRFGRVVLMFY